jgi:hypothetical protein
MTFLLIKNILNSFGCPYVFSFSYLFYANDSLGGEGRPGRKADNITVICERIV